MTAPENPLAKIAAELPAHIPKDMGARVQKILPGGFRNRLIQWGLGALLSLGLSYFVKRMLEKREQRKRAMARPPVRRAVPPPQAYQFAPATAGPAIAPVALSAEGAALPFPMLGRPHINLSGQVDQTMYASFGHQLALAPAEGPLVVAISTLGGDPEVARLMGDEIRLLRDYHGRDMVFLGKVSVYSAGTVLMSAFPADRRFLTRGARLLIHERIMTFYLSGSVRSLTETMRSHLGEVENAAKIEEAYFTDLIAGSTITLDDIRARAPTDWYIDAEEARTLGLVHDVI